MKLMAIHLIEYVDPKTKKRAIAEPGHPFDIADDEGGRLKNLKAARDLTEAERALEQVRNAGKKAPAQRGPTKSDEKNDGKAAKNDGKAEGGNGDDLV